MGAGWLGGCRLGVRISCLCLVPSSCLTGRAAPRTRWVLPARFITRLPLLFSPPGARSSHLFLPGASNHRETPLERARWPDTSVMLEPGRRGRASSCPMSRDVPPPAPSVLSSRGSLSWDGSSIAASPGLEGAESGVEVGRKAEDDGCMGGDHVRGCWGGQVGSDLPNFGSSCPLRAAERGQGEELERAQRGNRHPHPVAVGEVSARAEISPLGLSIILLGKTAPNSTSPCGRGENILQLCPAPPGAAVPIPTGARDPCPYLHPGFGQVRP